MCTLTESEQWFDDYPSVRAPLALILRYESLVFKVCVFSLEVDTRQHLLCKALNCSKAGVCMDGVCMLALTFILWKQ